MKTITLRPALPEYDFAQIAAWFSILENEPTSEFHLIEYYQNSQARIVQTLAEDDQGKRLGFGWLVQDKLKTNLAHLYLYVEPDRRGRGIGSQKYQELLKAAESRPIGKLR